MNNDHLVFRRIRGGLCSGTEPSHTAKNIITYANGFTQSFSWNFFDRSACSIPFNGYYGFLK